MSEGRGGGGGGGDCCPCDDVVECEWSLDLLCREESDAAFRPPLLLLLLLLWTLSNISRSFTDCALSGSVIRCVIVCVIGCNESNRYKCRKGLGLDQFMVRLWFSNKGEENNCDWLGLRQMWVVGLG